MWETSEVYLFLTLALLVLLAGLLLRDYRRDPSALASVFLIATVVGHLVMPILVARGAPWLVVQLAVILGLAVPFAFWLLAKAHFDDDFRLCPRNFLLLGLVLAVSYASWLQHQPRWGLGLVCRVLGLAFVGHGLATVSLGARSDLVVPRLKARYVVLIPTGLYFLVEMLAEMFLGEAVSPRLADTIHAVTSFLLVFGICFVSLRLQPDVLRPAQAPEAPVLDPALSERLLRLIEVEQVFREEGLTIAGLAERMAVHEYKVRQLINAQLGFRNFNSFLHHYRVREAQKALGDPSRNGHGVAQIAYEVGYRSLGPFNKAFKELTGQTPTEYRSARLA
jgi:AraC-like DNA-binding protein